MRERAGDGLLPHHLVEGAGPVLAGEDEVGHGKWKESLRGRPDVNPGLPAAHSRIAGPLLPSGPGGVGRLALRRAGIHVRPTQRYFSTSGVDSRLSEDRRENATGLRRAGSSRGLSDRPPWVRRDRRRILTIRGRPPRHRRTGFSHRSCRFEPFVSARACSSRSDSDLSWRRGWDSNPRYPFGYSSFRDCPLQPLAYLSGPFILSVAPVRKKSTTRPRHSSSRTPATTAKRWFAARVADLHDGLDRAPLRLGRAVDDGAHARADQGPDAHQARLDGHVQGGVRQTVVAQGGRGRAQGDDLRVRGGIDGPHGPVEALRRPRPRRPPRRPRSGLRPRPARGGPGRGRGP